jgi:hypothetical protein
MILLINLSGSRILGLGDKSDRWIGLFSSAPIDRLSRGPAKVVVRVLAGKRNISGCATRLPDQQTAAAGEWRRRASILVSCAPAEVGRLA